jgi:hypothetical protein
MRFAHVCRQPAPPAKNSAALWVIAGIVGVFALCGGFMMVIVVCLTAISVLGGNANRTFSNVAVVIQKTDNGPPRDVAPVRGIRLVNRDFIELTNTAKLIDLNGMYTVELWAKLGEEPKGEWIYLVSDESWDDFGEKTGNVTGWGLRFRPERFLDVVRAGDDNRWVGADCPPLATPLADKFHHYAVCKSENRLRIFIDGKRYFDEAVANRYVSCPGNLYLGIRRNALQEFRTNYTVGGFRISDSAIYENDFQPAERLGKQKGTLLLLDFASGPGDNQETIKDVSGNGHHGLLNGARWSQ